MSSPSSYPLGDLQRDEWILERRSARAALDTHKPYAYFVEDEPSSDREISLTATILLTNRECPWRCVMCDLWRNTLTTAVPPGAIPAQIDFALDQLPLARILKLYNSGSFFDVRAIPPEDYRAIAERANHFERLIVESHPALIGEACVRFKELLSCRFEIAMGLETVHPEILPRLNKRMSLEQFSDAAKFLRSNDIDLRAFILVQPPFMPPEESAYWAERSLDFAFECGATAVTLIPTRGGNGAMESLKAESQFAPPHISALEAAVEYGLMVSNRIGSRVFADLWDVDKIAGCADCLTSRISRLRQMNLHQDVLPPVVCAHGCNSCGPH